jgi:GNAT superfamily N-acetyltransferase
MLNDRFAQLDNPAWWALNSVQQQFAKGTDIAKRYQPGILPFAAYDQPTTLRLTELSNWLKPGEIFFIIGELPPLPSCFELLKELPCVQMVLLERIDAIKQTVPVWPLTAEHKDAMFNLINKVQPGYYEPDTYQLGSYYGIWHNDKLVAIAGERMRLDKLTEISAICTDPDFTGRQYAQQLIIHLCNTNLEAGITPFLHVLETNERAIRLYEYLGFKKRRIISFWQLKKVDEN